MKVMIWQNVKLEYPDELTSDEVIHIADDERRAWRAKGKELATIKYKLDGDYIEIFAIEKSPIKRLRRITGYLSNVENFNDAKQAELAQRYKHM